MSDILNNILAQTNQNKTAQPLPAIKLDLTTQNKIKPLDGRGKMLPSRIIGSPIAYVKDLKNDIVSIKKGATGKANDHELGKMNDLAMKAGSLGLAAYLFAKNPLKLKKTMEFVGFGSFFASMALWPKLAIQAPLKAKFGVDIHQKYEDSYGRKKTFFQDPQYIPWDLVSKEELNKMGDKLNVPKDIKNRDEVIKQKAQKIAVQGNTLWMMTAGFATPLMSALGCNLAERAILPLQEKRTLDKTEAALKQQIKNGTSQVSASYAAKNSAAKAALDSIFADENLSKKLTPEVIEELKNTLNLDENFKLGDAIEKELKQLATLAPDSKQVIDNNFVEELYRSSNIFERNNVSLDSLKATLINNQKASNSTKSVVSSIVDLLAVKTETSAKQVDTGKIQKHLTKALSEALKNEDMDENFFNTVFQNNRSLFSTAGIDQKALQELTKEGINLTTENIAEIAEKIAGLADGNNVLVRQNLEKEVTEALKPVIDKQGVKTLGEIKAPVKKMFNLIDNMMNNKKALNNYIDARIGDKAETYIANQWGRVNKTFMDSLGFTKKELEILKAGTGNTTAIIEQKLQELAKNPKAYNEAMEKLVDSINKYDKATSNLLNPDPDLAINNLKQVMLNNREKFDQMLKTLSEKDGKEMKKVVDSLYNVINKISPNNSDVNDKLVNELGELLSRTDKLQKKLPGTTPIINEIMEASSEYGNINKLFNNLANQFNDNGFKHLTQFIVGNNQKQGLAYTAPGSYKKSVQSFVEDRILGAKASFYRMVQTMDLYKRLETKEFEQKIRILTTGIEKTDTTPAVDKNTIIAFLKGKTVDISDDQKSVLENTFGKVFGEKVAPLGETYKRSNFTDNMAELFLKDDGKANWLVKNMKEQIESNGSVDDKVKFITDLFKKELGSWGDEICDNFTTNAVNFVKNPGDVTTLDENITTIKNQYATLLEQLKNADPEKIRLGEFWRKIGSMMETEFKAPLKNDGSIDAEATSKQISEIIQKCKTTLLEYKITDHTEKLNDVGNSTYKRIMGFLFQEDFSKETAEILKKFEATNNGIMAYKKEFVETIANNKYWYKPHHSLGKASVILDSGHKHLLIGSTIQDMVTKAANGKYNTNKWMKMALVSMGTLVGVTLVAQQFFGKMKKEDVYAGEQA